MANNQSSRKHKDPKTGRFSTTHGLARKAEYYVWEAIINRCENPRCDAYPWYGARGITVCERWHSVANFYADMGPRPSAKYTIERLDNSGPYSPENCAWVSHLVQARNKRNNRWLTWNGETKTLAEWARTVSFNHKLIHDRLKRGWSIDDALHTPPAQGHSWRKTRS